jgi:hypothetical protein
MITRKCHEREARFLLKWPDITTILPAQPNHSHELYLWLTKTTVNLKAVCSTKPSLTAGSVWPKRQISFREYFNRPFMFLCTKGEKTPNLVCVGFRCRLPGLLHICIGFFLSCVTLYVCNSNFFEVN